MQHQHTRGGSAFGPGGWVALGWSLSFGLFLALVATARTVPPPEAGRVLFQQSCVGCHSVGQGDRVGPDLKGVTEKRERDWLLRWLREPDKVLAEGDALAGELLKEYNNVPMPNLGLTEVQAANLIAYLESLEGEAEPSAPPSERTEVAAGDPVLGQELFTGSLALQNGGPACMSCHSIAGNGALGGGTLGPDLTKVRSRYGNGLAAVLQSLPFPTMQGVFGNKPLAKEEAANLYAYFAQTDAIAPQPVSFNFVWAGLGVFVVLSLLCQLIWRKRLSGVRKPLLGGTK